MAFSGSQGDAAATSSRLYRGGERDGCARARETLRSRSRQALRADGRARGAAGTVGFGTRAGGGRSARSRPPPLPTPRPRRLCSGWGPGELSATPPRERGRLRPCLAGVGERLRKVLPECGRRTQRPPPLRKRVLSARGRGAPRSARPRGPRPNPSVWTGQVGKSGYIPLSRGALASVIPSLNVNFLFSATPRPAGRQRNK